MAAQTKRCSDCGKDRPRLDFYEHPQTADGYFSRCKRCCRSARNRRYRKDKKRPVNRDNSLANLLRPYRPGV
jgi:hypothetical protein